jgi:hypothetical protein
MTLLTPKVLLDYQMLYPISLAIMTLVNNGEQVNPVLTVHLHRGTNSPLVHVDE